MKRLFMIFFLLLGSSAKTLRALEIDEKLTLRFLKVSTTKKTVLINRGAEDGLVVGDHAKFYISSGIIARGVVEKVSPSRSIWSMYRLVEPNDVTEGKVLNLKIASPVKITTDSTKSIKEEAIPGSEKRSESESVKNNNTSKENAKAIDAQDMKELEELGAKKDEDSTSKTESTEPPVNESSKKSKVLKK
jgi:hypothetical protein